MDRLYAVAYAPLFFVSFLAAGVAAIDIWQLPLVSLVGLAGLAILVSFLAERRWPQELEWNGIHADTPRDVAHASVNELLNIGGIALWGTAAAALAPEALQGLWPHEWPLGAQVLVAIVIADVGFTLAHFASHRIPWLWRLHAVHHSVTRMYGFNGLMKHPLHQMVEAGAAFAPLLLLGAPSEVAAMVGYAALIQLLLQHSNVAMRIGALRHVFAWAPVHRFHHMKYGASGDVNFAFFFSFWDRLLGTSFHTAAHRITTRDLGIGSRADFPVGYLAQLSDPFRQVKKNDVPETPPELRSR